MKVISYITLISTSLFLQAAALAAEPTPQLVRSAFQIGYIPLGFDGNDHVQIVAEGVYPNSCYKPAAPSFRVENGNIVVGARAYLYNGPCLEVLVPHYETIELGIVPPGKYNVISETEGAKMGSLVVQPSKTLSADDYLYAPISQAYYRKENNRQFLFLNGTFSNSCLSMKTVKVTVQEKVIVVQPIATMALDEQNCTNVGLPFDYGVELKNVKPGRYLLHIRALNGKAVNNLIDIN